MTLVIHDEALARKVRERAQAVGKSTDEFIRAAVEAYKPSVEAFDYDRTGENGGQHRVEKYQSPVEAVDPDKAVRFRRVYLRAYAKARAYWEKAGDSDKAALTDEQLAEQFAYFDEEGIPRLKSEVPAERPEPEPGTLRYAAMMIEKHGGIHAGSTLDGAEIDDFLNAEYPDYLIRRMRGEDV